MWKPARSPSAPLIAWHSLPASLRSISSNCSPLRRHLNHLLLLLCRNRRSRGLRIAGLLRVTAFFLALARQEGVDWIIELKAYLTSRRLPEDEEEAERIVRQALGYCVKDGDLYRRRPNGVALKCISTHQGQELLRDIHTGECRHHASAATLAAKAYRSRFYWPSALGDAAEMVKEVRGVPIPRQADTSAGARAANHPTHLALCSLGAGHPRSISQSARGLSLPLRRH
jgi:hypothetical protein